MKLSKCLRCNHTWYQRTPAKPRICPKCKSAYWNVPRKRNEEGFDDNKYNKSEHIYNFGKGKIEFFPADEPSKMRGGRRDILFINEDNG